MQDHKSFYDLDNKGVVHYIHSQAYQLEMIYEDTEDDKLYRLVLQKDFTITSVTEIKTPASVASMNFDKWHKASMNSQGDFIFTGCLNTAELGDYRFNIDTTELVLVKPVQMKDDFSFQDLKSLEGVVVDHHVQRGSLLYVVGFVNTPDAPSSQVFIETHIGIDKALRRYTLGSDEGSVYIHTLGLDHWNNQLYLGGEVRIHSEDSITSKPYLEVICYNHSSNFKL